MCFVGSFYFLKFFLSSLFAPRHFIFFIVLMHILCFFWSLAVIFNHILVVQCSLHAFSQPAFVPLSEYLFISLSPSCIQLIGGSVRGGFKAHSWSRSASLQVIRKCTDMLICTKPTLLMKTQYRLPFIRLIMKYQYHLPSYIASVNRSSPECVSPQSHLEQVPSINPKIAPYGCETLELLMDASASRVR